MSSEGSRDVQLVSAFNILGSSISANDIQEFVDGLPETYKMGDEVAISAMKPTDRMKRDDFIKRLTMFLWEFQVDPDNPHGDIFYGRKRFTGAYDEKPDFAPMDRDEIKDVVHDIWGAVFNCTPQSEIKACAENVAQSVRERADTHNKCWRVSPDYYYTSDQGVVAYLTHGKKAYHRLEGAYQLISESGTQTTMIDEYEKWAELLKKKSEEYGSFDKFYEDLPMDFEFVKTWANPNVPRSTERYWDMMVALAVPFFKKLPKKVYFLNGPSRSGKSAFVNLLHYIFGRRNTSTVRLADLDNWDVNNALAGTLLNAPDEELGGEVSLKAASVFKTIATHGRDHEELNLAKKNSAKGITMIPDFMCYFPSNSIPKFPDKEAGPCMKRAMVIIFSADLSHLDTGNKDFIEGTIEADPEMFAKLMGQVFALAQFFSTGDREVFISSDMANANEFLATENNSLELYYKAFYTFFDGVANLSLHYKDYTLCCKEFGWSVQSESAFRQRFVGLHSNKPTPQKIDGITVRCVRTPKFSSPRILTKNTKEDGYGDVEQMHENNVSIVAVKQKKLRLQLEQAEEEKAEKRAQLEFAYGKKRAKKEFGEYYE